MRTTVSSLVILILSCSISFGQNGPVEDNFGFKEYHLLTTLGEIDSGTIEPNIFSTHEYLKEYRVKDSTLTVGGEMMSYLRLYFLSDTLIRIEVGIEFPRKISDVKTFYRIISERYGDPSEISRDEILNDYVSLEAVWTYEKYRLKYDIHCYAGRDKQSNRDSRHSLIYQTIDFRERLEKARDKKIEKSSRDF